MTNDFIYDMSEINEEEMMKAWEDLADEADYISGLDDGEWADYDEDSEWDIYGEEEFA